MDRERCRGLETLAWTPFVIGHARVKWLFMEKKQDCMYHACMHLWALTTCCYFTMDNKVQALLTLSSLLAAAVQLQSAFHHANMAYTRRRKDYILLCSAQFPFLAVTSALHWLVNFINGVVDPEEWWENFFMSVQIGAYRPEWKTASTCGGNNNNVDGCGCFYKVDLHIVLTLLKRQGKISKHHQCIWIILTRCFCHHWTRLKGCHHLPGARLTLYRNTAHRARSDGV